MPAVPQHAAGLTRMSKEEQASPASSCCLSLVPLIGLKLSLAAGKGLVLQSAGQEIQVSHMRITASAYKVRVKINPLLIGVTSPSKSEPS